MAPSAPSPAMPSAPAPAAVSTSMPSAPSQVGMTGEATLDRLIREYAAQRTVIERPLLATHAQRLTSLRERLEQRRDPAATAVTHLRPRTADSAGAPFSAGVLAGNTLYLSGVLGLDSTGAIPADVATEDGAEAAVARLARAFASTRATTPTW